MVYKSDWEYWDLTWDDSDIKAYLRYTYYPGLKHYTQYLAAINGDNISLLTSAQFAKYKKYLQDVPTDVKRWWLTDTTYGTSKYKTRYCAKYVDDNEEKHRHVSNDSLGVRPIIQFVYE